MASEEAGKQTIHVTVWNEYRHERQDPQVATIYPEGIHSTIDAFLSKAGLAVRTATLDEPENGLPPAVLNNTDVLVWWGHLAHREVRDEVVERVQTRVLEGMGLVVLHSAHLSKIFRRLMGTSCDLTWRENGELERLWVIEHSHPITEGLSEYFEIEHEETYGEPFDVPPPETLVFVSWFSDGNVFRSGLCYTRGRGRIFYFRPGHETLPTYHHPAVQRVITNAVRWAAPYPGLLQTARVFGNMPSPSARSQ
ncbi:MAG TPA: ThuA domain-containing protein [Ktedonobacteraceae bacterium]|nr:ThuA domain-containing protein [Ktedonobacteraceae bacterium]